MSSLLPVGIITLALGLGLQTTAQDAAAPRPAPRHEDRHEEARLAAKLHLSDAQKVSLQGIRAKHQDSLASKRTAAAEAHTALGQAMDKPESRPEDLKALHQTYSSLSFELKLEQRAMRQELRAQLSPEQREQSARMEGRMEGMRRPHGGHGPAQGMGWDRKPDDAK